MEHIRGETYKKLLHRRARLGVRLPSSYLRALREFIQRNALVREDYSLQDGRVGAICCDQCLKAYALRLARDMHLEEDALNYVGDLFPCETGHDGYYLDRESLRRF